VQPPVPGITSPGVHTCWTLPDARAIAARAQPGARVVQVGAGFIGCIIMEALAARGVELTVVEMGDRMVPRMMGAGAAEGPFAEMQKQAQDEMMKAISVGFGTYLSALVSLYLAAISAKQFLVAKAVDSDVLSKRNQAAA